MMKKNLSRFERVIRPLLGGMAIAIALSRPSPGISEAIVCVLGVFLILNGLTARCYLWKALGIDTAKDERCEFDEPSED